MHFYRDGGETLLAGREVKSRTIQVRQSENSFRPKQMGKFIPGQICLHHHVSASGSPVVFFLTLFNDSFVQLLVMLLPDIGICGQPGTEGSEQHKHSRCKDRRYNAQQV